MNILDLKEDIIKNKIRHVYLFHGTERGVMKIYLKEISNKLSVPISPTDSLADVYSDLGGSLFGVARQIYVVYEDKNISKLGKSLEELESDLGDSYLVMVYDKIDGRSSVFKELSDCSVVFEPLSQSVLVSYIRKACPLNVNNANALATIAGGSYDTAMLECDKINQYAQHTDRDVDTVFKKFVDEDAYDITCQKTVFDFTDAVMSKQMSKAYSLYQGLRENDVNAVSILGTLYSSMKNTLLVQICEGDVCEVTGLSSGVAYYAGKYKGKYGAGKLVETVRLIARVTEDIKNGMIDEQYAVPYILTTLC